MEINATFLGQAVAFLIFAVICMKYVWPPLLGAIEKRQKEIADGLDSAEKAKKSLELANENAKETIRKARAEAQKIIDEANKTRSQIIDKASTEAQEERKKILDLAKKWTIDNLSNSTINMKTLPMEVSKFAEFTIQKFAL